MPGRNQYAPAIAAPASNTMAAATRSNAFTIGSSALETQSVTALRMQRELLLTEALAGGAHVDGERTALQVGDVERVAPAGVETSGLIRPAGKSRELERQAGSAGDLHVAPRRLIVVAGFHHQLQLVGRP